MTRVSLNPVLGMARLSWRGPRRVPPTSNPWPLCPTPSPPPAPPHPHLPLCRPLTAPAVFPHSPPLDGNFSRLPNRIYRRRATAPTWAAPRHAARCKSRPQNDQFYWRVFFLPHAVRPLPLKKGKNVLEYILEGKVE